jgi:hypothetical protein
MAPNLLDLLPERYRRAASRLARRRLARYDRGLPMDLTEPLSPEQAAAPPIPYETMATRPRPASAVIAAGLLAGLGGMMAAVGVTELGGALIGLVNEPAVDGMTKLVQLVVAAFVAGTLLAVLVLAIAHGYAAWRVWQGINWGWIEGLAVAVIGGGLGVLTLGLTDVGWQLSPIVVLVLAAYLAAIGAILAARSWLGPVRFPMNRDKAPWWMRIADRWR